MIDLGNNIFMSDVVVNCLINITILIGLPTLKTDRGIFKTVYYFMIMLDEVIVTFTSLHYCIIVKIIRKFSIFVNDNLTKILSEPIWILEITEDMKISLQSKLENLIKFYSLTYEISEKASSLCLC